MNYSGNRPIKPIPHSSERPVVMVFAGHDPSGGAGLQADIETLNAVGCHPITVLTALTIQDSSHVHAFEPMTPKMIIEQALTVMREFPVNAIKTGMLGSAKNIRAIAELLGASPSIPVVVDPVLASNRGQALSRHNLAQAYRDYLLPMATVCTPNSIEAEQLASGEKDPSKQAKIITDMGSKYLLITGAHEAGETVFNSLYSSTGPVQKLGWPRLDGEYHGSGCTLASAIAGGLAKGKSMQEAVSLAQSYTYYSLARAADSISGQRIPVRL